MKRCEWCLGDPIYEAYHDHEWGVPVRDDQQLFEFLILETFQAGLSWITVLKKREQFRLAFNQFDFEKISQYDQDKILELENNAGIIRNKLKIRAAITNARAFIDIRKTYGSFSDFIWAFVNHKPIQNRFSKQTDLPANTPLSDEISKVLKKHGFKFIGSTVIYAHMQATGMVNDHIESCFRYKELQ